MTAQDQFAAKVAHLQSNPEDMAAFDKKVDDLLDKVAFFEAMLNRPLITWVDGKGYIDGEALMRVLGRENEAAASFDLASIASLRSFLEYVTLVATLPEGTPVSTGADLIAAVGQLS